jgi:hypothetical protein
MATTNGNRKILDLKRWEFCAPAPGSTGNSPAVVSSEHCRTQQIFINSTDAWLYNPDEDGWAQLPSHGLSNSGLGPGGAASAVSIGASTGASQLTATDGTTTTIVTNQTLARDLRGFYVHITGGPNAGATLQIRSNTVSANATITVDAQASAFTSSTTYRLITPVWYCVGGSSSSAGSVRKYDFATNSWVTLANSPINISSEHRVIGTPSWQGSDYLAFATGTATGGGANTISNSAKSWTTNQWANYQIRIVSGTGAGQIKTISSNTGTQITVSSNWATEPDSTSTYSIEGNDDYIYLIVANTANIYRYSISANAWTTLSPSVARSGTGGFGITGDWVSGATDAEWTSEGAIRNGRRIYSFRGGGTATLDYYDIAANTWVNSVSYAPTVILSSGTKTAYIGDHLYIQINVTGRWVRLNFVTNEIEGWSVMTYPQGSANGYNTAFNVKYTDGATRISYVYMILNNSNVMLRQMVI